MGLLSTIQITGTEHSYISTCICFFSLLNNYTYIQYTSSIQGAFFHKEKNKQGQVPMIQTFYYVEILKIQNTCIITRSWPQGTCRLFMTCRLKFLLIPWNYITFEYLICLFVSDYSCFICLHVV